MASPVDTFKNSLFGQLKSYSNAVQGAFEQRIGKRLFIYFFTYLYLSKKNDFYVNITLSLKERKKIKFIHRKISDRESDKF
jgi:hypothetical protein